MMSIIVWKFWQIQNICLFRRCFHSKKNMKLQQSPEIWIARRCILMQWHWKQQYNKLFLKISLEISFRKMDFCYRKPQRKCCFLLKNRQRNFLLRLWMPENIPSSWCRQLQKKIFIVQPFRFCNFPTIHICRPLIKQIFSEDAWPSVINQKNRESGKKPIRICSG